ncbi:MAG: resolvase [Firmicutes bacterium HGW-Firmicutes-4]|jgi:DNA invertase Pin-like site-specific DNA recombinase|nr:MAG: resolvase [Firmicutes bacterium HGW-Firmicutes-4]
MNTYFYIRVSSKDQNTIRQEVKAKEIGIPVGNVFIEKVSGKNVTDRPVLTNMMTVLKSGDKLIVDSISRFARNTKDLIELVEQLNEKGVIFVSLKEAIDTTTPTGIFMLTVFGAVAQLEREYIRQRQAEGIAIAVAQGKFKGRKPVEYPKQWDKYYKMIKDGAMTNVEAMKLMDLKKTTFYKLVKDYECNCN